MRVVLVCGGRDYDDKDRLYAVMDDLLAKTGEIGILVHGDANGADRLADMWAVERGINVARVPALWGTHGKGAGPIRNKAMLALHPDEVVAFPGGNGTLDMRTQARKAGVFVWDVGLNLVRGAR